MELVTFIVGDQEYGIPINNVREIIMYEPPHRVAGVPIAGIINLRGSIIPVLDLLEKFNVDAKKDKIMIVQKEEQLYGLIVTEVKEVIRVEENNIRDLPNDIDNICVSKIIELPNKKNLIMLVDVEAILGR